MISMPSHSMNFMTLDGVSMISGLRHNGRLHGDMKSRKRMFKLILIGIVSGVLEIFSIVDGDVFECKQVAVAGTGYAVAEAALYWRMDHDSPRTLEQTIYAVYEAKKLSEMSPYVGQKSIMGVLTATENGVAYAAVDTKSMERKFKRFGPKAYRQDKNSTFLRYVNPPFSRDPQDSTDAPSSPQPLQASSATTGES